jgi:hypothetical protein
MGKKFVIELNGEPSDKLAKIKIAAAEKYVSFEGDINEGYFSGGNAICLLIRGTYSIKGSIIKINFLQKPTSYTWDDVELELRKFIEA